MRYFVILHYAMKLIPAPTPPATALQIILLPFPQATRSSNDRRVKNAAGFQRRISFFHTLHLPRLGSLETRNANESDGYGLLADETAAMYGLENFRLFCIQRLPLAPGFPGRPPSACDDSGRARCAPPPGPMAWAVFHPPEQDTFSRPFSGGIGP